MPPNCPGPARRPLSTVTSRILPGMARHIALSRCDFQAINIHSCTATRKRTFAGIGDGSRDANVWSGAVWNMRAQAVRRLGLEPVGRRYYRLVNTLKK